MEIHSSGKKEFKVQKIKYELLKKYPAGFTGTVWGGKSVPFDVPPSNAGAGKASILAKNPYVPKDSGEGDALSVPRVESQPVKAWLVSMGDS